MGKSKGTSLFENGLIWFGAAVSVAEIMTGTYFAPIGFEKGLAAIVIGHVLGCFLLFLAGVIGGRTRKSAMETVKMSFGEKGSLLFSVLNIVQLLGWTGIMIYDGAISANGLLGVGHPLWCILIGGLIILWIIIGIKNLGKLNTVAMAALFVLTAILGFVIFSGGHPVGLPAGALSFGAAIELSVAMPLSWLPLISDYTREAEEPVKASAVSAVVYGFVSTMMYVIGMSAALFTGESDIAAIMLKAGLGIAGLIIIVLSTVTTTFLDALSAGISAESISKKINGKWIAVAATVIGTVAAMIFPMDDITEFLYLIGSVFAPMIAVQITMFFILKKDFGSSSFSVVNLMVWFIGFIIYRLFMHLDLPLGSTLPAMLVTMIICYVGGRFFGGKNPEKQSAATSQSELTTTDQTEK